jgi:hypothetical protein
MTHKLINILKENILIILLVCPYIAIGYFLQYFFNIPKMMNIHLTHPVLILTGIVFSACFLVVQIIRGKTWEYLNIQFLTGFIVIVFLSVPFVCTFASIKQVIPVMKPFCWDRVFMQIDTFLHFGFIPWEIFKPLINNENILRIIDAIYMSWFLLLLIYCLWMAWTFNRKLRLHFFISTLFVWIFLGSFLGTFFSSAGPCYYSKVVEFDCSDNPYYPLLNKLCAYNELKPLWAVHNQYFLWENKISGNWLPFGGISAMPSIHVAMAIIFIFVGWQTNKLFGIVMIFYALIIQIGSVMLAWHYAVDGYFSILATILIWILTGRLLDSLNYLVSIHGNN